MNQKPLQTYGRRTLAMLLAVLMALGTFITHQLPVFAANGTLTFNSGESIAYGDYFTTRMTFDGDNTAYCAQPMKATPAVGVYEYDLLGNDSEVRKALYYLPGGYGYDSTLKTSILSDWSTDDAYVIGHLAVSYLYAGRDSGSGAFYGAPQSFIDTTISAVAAIDNFSAAPDAFKAFVVPSDSSQTIVGSWYAVPNGWIEIVKNSANASVSNGNSSYSLEGAQFDIYQGDSLVETLTTDKNGYAKSAELEADKTYTVKETTASPGFAIDATPHDVTVNAGTTSTVEIGEVPQNNPIGILLQKVDAQTGENTAQGSASLENAEFTVKYYTQLSDTDPAENGTKPERTWVFRTSSDGKISFENGSLVSGDDLYYQTDGRTLCLPIGTVTVQETAAPAGYLADTTVYVQKITASGSEETLNCYNTSTVPESIIRGGVKIQKRDLETGKAEAQGSASLEKAIFTITTLNDNAVLVDNVSYTKDQVVLTLETDAAGFTSTAADALPYGHYRVDEITPPSGYLKEGASSLEFDIVNHGEIVDLSGEDSSIRNQIIRGDLEFVKVSDGDLNRLADVPFAITSKTTGESHTIISDKNGYVNTASSWNKHTANTNRGETSEDGIWFGTSEPNDEKGALPYDTYTLEEQRCKANEGMNLLKIEITIYKDSVVIPMGTLTDDYIEIATTALEKDSSSHFAPAKENLTLIDTVEYKGLKKGQKYKLVGTLMDKETGDALLIDGNVITSEITFTAKKTEGRVEVAFTFDATSLKGKTIVVFEDLYQEDLKLAVHADINDEDQTVYFPEVKTSAKDAKDNDQKALADKDVTLIDTVSYKNLIPGGNYKVSGILMDKATGKAVEIDGKQITAEAAFTAEHSEGTVEVTFQFDGSTLAGHDVVIFEKLFFINGETETEIASHEDLEDKDQTIILTEPPKEETPKKETPKETTSVSPVKTGDSTQTVFYLGLALSALLLTTGLGITLYRKRKSNNADNDK